MIQITFTPGNSAQADLIGKLMAQYLALDAAPTAEAAQAVETAAVEQPAAPKATRARKPAATSAEPAPAPLADSGTENSTATEQTASPSDPKPAAAPSEPEAAAAPTASSTAPAVSLEQVRAKLAELSKAGKQTQVVALIGSMGAKKLTDIPAEKFGELMQQAEAL